VETGYVRTTFELPDDLLLQIRSEAARSGVRLDQLVADLIQAGLAVRRLAEDVPPDTCDLGCSERWLEEWLSLGTEWSAAAQNDVTAAQILDDGRSRLDER